MLTLAAGGAPAPCSRRRGAPNGALTRPPPTNLVAASMALLPSRCFVEHPAGAKPARRPRVLFLDVKPLCFRGATPSLRELVRWLALFFTNISHRDPVVAVVDGDNANEYRRRLMPSYKAHRRREIRGPGAGMDPWIVELLCECNVPVVKVDGYEADDVVATLSDQALQKGFHVVIASPDKDFKQLVADNVQLALPIPEICRWSIYSVRHYIAQYNCDPAADLSLRCFLGDEVDGIPGIHHVVPGFGRKTAIRLLRKHGSLENLLNTAAIRTVGRDYVQNALIKYASYLRKNYEVLSLRRDANIQLEDKWLSERDSCSDSVVLSNFIKKLRE